MPKRSPSHAVSGSTMTFAAAYPETTQLTWLRVAPSEFWMGVSATLTMLVSTTSSIAPSATATATPHLLTPGGGPS